MNLRTITFAAAVVQGTTLVRPALGTIMYLRSRDRLAGQRASVLAALATGGGGVDSGIRRC